MLEAIIATSLGNGDTDENEATHSLEVYIAGLVGYKASLLVASGTMGNQVAHQAALRSPPYSILADSRGHFHTFECGRASYLSSVLVRQAIPSNGHHLTLDDVQRQSTLGDSIYEVPTRVLSLENTQWYYYAPLRCSRHLSVARAQGPPIHMHLDGARLWYPIVLNKGVGAPLGSIVTGGSVYIKRANWSRKVLGGEMHATGIIAASARIAVDDVFFGGKLKAGQVKGKYASDYWEQLGGKLAMPTETNIV
ncbi:putative low-specificity L-threonine aldolase 1 [Aspergillus hancockii]|nr:putative low-specificity L-threonine aldolase 1 [Aspergillus hancockii]